MTDGLSFDDLCSLFIVSLLEKAHAFSGDQLSKFQRSRLGESMTADIRKLGDMVFPAARTPLISAAAREAADALGCDLRNETWHSQKKIDGYKTFTYEHVFPVREIRLALGKAPDVAAATEVLNRMLWVAWITKGEDKRLHELGFASTRSDPWSAYRQAGIELLSDAQESAFNQVLPCAACGEPGGYLVTASINDNAQGRLLIYCDECRRAKIDMLPVSLPLAIVLQDPNAALELLYRSGATASDRDHVALMLRIPRHEWGFASS